MSLPSQKKTKPIGTRPSVDEYFMQICYDVSKRSTCVRRQVGCVLTDVRNRIIATGHNGVAMGQPHCINTPCDGAQSLSGQNLDKCEAIHAEQNALMFCPDPFKINVCYVTAFPCIHCIKMLMNTSCEFIIYSETYGDMDRARRLWSRKSRAALQVTYVDGELKRIP